MRTLKPRPMKVKPNGSCRPFGDLHAQTAVDALARLVEDARILRMHGEGAPVILELALIGFVKRRVTADIAIRQGPAIAMQAGPACSIASFREKSAVPSRRVAGPAKAMNCDTSSSLSCLMRIEKGFSTPAGRWPPRY